MRIGSKVKNLTNDDIIKYNNKNYNYSGLYNLIKNLDYNTSDYCNWKVLKITNLKTSKKSILIVFEESRQNDWKYDLIFLGKRYNKLKYHKGILEEYLMCKDELKSKLSFMIQDLCKENECHIEDIDIFITGWSLGGGIAQICANDIFDIYSIKSTIICYESPNVCYNYKTIKTLKNNIKDGSVLFIYDMDCIPRVPPFPIARKLKNYIYYMNRKDEKFPFILIKKIISMIKNTEYLHTHVDEGINLFLK